MRFTTSRTTYQHGRFFSLRDHLRSDAVFHNEGMEHVFTRLQNHLGGVSERYLPQGASVSQRSHGRRSKKQRSAACHGWHANVPEGDYLEAKKAAQMMDRRRKSACEMSRPDDWIKRDVEGGGLYKRRSSLLSPSMASFGKLRPRKAEALRDNARSQGRRFLRGQCSA